jgi:hypothetical protein
MFRTRSWPTEKRYPAVLVFIGYGFVYTVGSEWFNTQVAVTWTYAPSMPLVFGIGGSKPYLQSGLDNCRSPLMTYFGKMLKYTDLPKRRRCHKEIDPGRGDNSFTCR